MSEIKHEITTLDFEKNERAKSFYEKNKKNIEKLLEEIKNKLGEGATAEVYFLDSNEKLCLKILKSTKELPYHVSLEQEMVFLSQLQDIDEEVRVPKPYLAADYGENNEECGVRFMLMERLNASSVKDILDGKGDLPANFNIVSFKNKISKFLEKMHEKNIYHRDLQEGNIMIDNETGDLYIIDFGASTRGFGEDNPYREEKLQTTMIFTDDKTNLNQVCLSLKKNMM